MTEDDCIKEITEILNSNINEKNRIYELPINSINKIQIHRITLEINEKRIYLSIQVEGFNICVFNRYYLINERITNDLLKQIFTEIKCLKWQNVNCVFKSNIIEDDEENLTNLFNKIFKDDSNIKTTIKECIVCYNFTRAKTECDHCVCLECVQKISKENKDEEKESLFNCPYCREECYFLEIN